VRNVIAYVALGILLAIPAGAETQFIEAETFVTPSDGWQVISNAQARRASLAATLNGASGPGDAKAVKPITIAGPGTYRVWVRYMQHRSLRGAFRLAVARDDTEIAGRDFDLDVDQETEDWDYRWDFFDADLPAGELELQLTKCEKRKCSSYVRHVDCVLITTDLDLKPNHIDYGPQTYLRVTLGGHYTEEPVYIHVFADHYRSPWYGHFHLSKNGAGKGYGPHRKFRMKAGEATPWCNITPMLYQDSGAILNFSIRYNYYEWADRMQAKFEFASAPDESSVVRTIDEDRMPNGLVVTCPPDLTSRENRERLRIDRDFAEETGRFADSFNWPTIGKAPESFLYMVNAQIGGYGHDAAADVTAREQKTLGYFGYRNPPKTRIGGVWYMKDNSFCSPNLDRMQDIARRRVEEFKDSGRSLDDVAYCMLMDEPTGQQAEFMAGDEGYLESFPKWLRDMGKSPADLLVNDWSAVKPTPGSDRDEFPALYYYTQRYRTIALGNFLAVQKNVVTKAYDREFPVLVNFSDGATYHANMYSQGVDYFALLNETDQNAIWGEDWANNSSTYQCASYNVDLMRAAARKRGQLIGHYLIAHAGRTPWDTKLKCASEVARGVKIIKTYHYGPTWGNHSGGPWWKSHLLYAQRDNWYANAESVREVGWAEDFLVPAMPAPAKTAIIYSSASDIWTVGKNYTYGFERMHIWLALAHAQVPVDFLHENDVADGNLHAYTVCYFTGPNLTASAADRLSQWVGAGGTLWLSAGAAARDEFDRPTGTIERILPVQREPVVNLQAYESSGKFLYSLDPKGDVRAGECTMNVLGLQQAMATKPGTETLATSEDGSAALVRGASGKGTIYCAGFLPALHYIKSAQDAKRAVKDDEAAVTTQPEHATIGDFDEAMLLKGSYNPWAFPADVRAVLLQPVRSAQIDPPVKCSAPLVDAVYMTCDKGILIPLANYTLQPIRELELAVRVPRDIAEIETAHQGRLKFERSGDRVVFSLPLGATDFVKLHFK